ncbi:hypothetical protein BASA50_006735 [Batrachochytrium salamandrivorans]|uniref:mRNA-capping enzyme subunit beta n=1 Tax=Batrachochytrium salamandrivorans TaxID=1357716 RepID=A0ABQ8FA77_9FUNG|nr:hypothetical protein BASA62_001372 [Batrachochytrium salamandrivorans]KAH6594264.1 hypothetical protein BASA50_006735 [Batrachochytrium salamandrivorans]KAH9270055.1 hypothetical protein BASA83_007884 [Batrachochytrium salamandrivorans]
MSDSNSDTEHRLKRQRQQDNQENLQGDPVQPRITTNRSMSIFSVTNITSDVNSADDPLVSAGSNGTDHSEYFGADTPLSATAASSSSVAASSSAAPLPAQQQQQQQHQHQPPNQQFTQRYTPPLFWPTIHMDVTEQVGHFIKMSIQRAQEMMLRQPSQFRSEIEIEVKLGRVCDKESRGRIRMPVLSETVLDSSGGFFIFESNMSRDMHGLLNQRLNHLVSQPRSPVRYIHLYEEDQFFHVQGVGKVRKTINTKTKQTKCIISKVNVANLEVFMPSSPLDYRVSVNIEKHIDVINPLKSPDFSRFKDRLSYTLSPFQVDLTQVKRAVEGPHNSVKQIGEDMHELEVEFNRPDKLIAEMERESRRQPNAYLDLVHALLTNVRLLIKKSIPSSSQ